MVGKNWGRYVRQYIYVGLTRMGANGEGVSSLLGCVDMVHTHTGLHNRGYRTL